MLFERVFTPNIPAETWEGACEETDETEFFRSMETEVRKRGERGLGGCFGNDEIDLD